MQQKNNNNSIKKGFKSIYIPIDVSWHFAQAKDPIAAWQAEQTYVPHALCPGFCFYNAIYLICSASTSKTKELEKWASNSVKTPWKNCIFEKKRVFQIPTSTLPRTPASSIVSLKAASSMDSSISQPPWSYMERDIQCYWI